MKLKEELIKLVALQELDVQIYKLQQERDVEITVRLEKLNQEYAGMKQELESLETSVRTAQLEKKNKELDLASKEELILKNQSQLYQLKTNKEYQAKLSEIASLKADISVWEEHVLKALDTLEKEEAKLKTERELIAKKEEENKRKNEEIIKEKENIETQIKVLEDKRNIFSKDIDKNILSKYENLLKTRSGLAIVPITQESCGACFIRIRHQTINEIKMYSDLVICGNCVRILYLPEDLEG